MKHLIICSTQFNCQNSTLVHEENFNLTLLEDTGQFHTSIGDLPAKKIIEFSKTCTDVEFVSQNYKEKELRSTNHLLNYLSHTKDIKNFIKTDPNTFLSNDTKTRPHGPCIWSYGCSFAKGVGVNLNDSYTEILSSTLAMPSIKINQLGVSIRWQLRHILNSTFQAGDLVIWQIPPASRFSIKHENINLPVETSLKDTKKEFFYSVTQDQLIFDHLSLLNYGVMFLRAQSIKFRIILHEDSSNLFPILDEITKYPEFVYIPQWIIDVGSDNLHPGKLSHKLVAKTILDNL